MIREFMARPFWHETAAGYGVTVGGRGASRSGRLRVETVTRYGVTTATLAGDLDQYRSGSAVWILDPPAEPYTGAVMDGPTALFKPREGETRVSALVEAVDGGMVMATGAAVRSVGYMPDVMNTSTVVGPAAVPVEAFIGLPYTARDVTAELWQIGRGTIGTRDNTETLVHSRSVNFTADDPVTLSHPVGLPEAGPDGTGWEWEWRVHPKPGVTVTSDVLPVWVLPQRLAALDLDMVPSFPRPDVYRRDTATFRPVEPLPGKTYQDHQRALVEAWGGTEKTPDGRNRFNGLGGVWLNFTGYTASVYVVDLDDPTVPRRRVEFFDHWTRGWGEMDGWYGDDTRATPPQNRVAVDVPIPDYARPAYGTDRALTIVGTRGGEVEAIWEFWIMRRRADGTWWAASAGRTTEEMWRHALGYTTSASGIAHLAGCLLMSEYERAATYAQTELDAGRTPDSETIAILAGDHCLSAAFPNPSGRMVSWPAVQNDGTNPDPAVPVEGQFFYLDPTQDVWALGLPMLHSIIGVILQRRGAFVTDRTNWSGGLTLEADLPYSRKWGDLTGGASPLLKFPDQWFAPAKTYTSEAEFRADMEAP